MMTFLHSGWAYIALIALLVAIANALFRIKGGQFSDRDFRLSLFALIATHIQLLLGLITYFTSERFGLWSDLGADVMRNPLARKLLVEHPLTNIIAIAFITMGWSRHKRKSFSKSKFKQIAVFYGLGLLLILSRLPWKQWWAIA